MVLPKEILFYAYCHQLAFFVFVKKSVVFLTLPLSSNEINCDTAVVRLSKRDDVNQQERCNCNQSVLEIK
jgi:hypothetical protein